MGEDSLAFDSVLELCKARHRRIVLAVLAEEQRPLTVNDLTTAIAKHNHHATVSELPSEDLSEIRLSLHHGHLPKIADAGLVDYDPERGLVEPTAQFEQVRPPLSAIVDADPDLDAPVEL